VFFEKCWESDSFLTKKFLLMPKLTGKMTELAYNPEDVLVVIRTKFPANVHGLDVVSSQEDVMPPNFFKKREIVTKEVYLHVLMELKPWMETVAFGRPYVFQQKRCTDSYESLDSKLALSQR